MSTIIAPISSAAIDTLRQMFLRGPTWDGNLVSKSGRSELVTLGLAECWDGWQWLTAAGVELAVTAGTERVKDDEWRRKAACQ